MSYGVYPWILTLRSFHMDGNNIIHYTDITRVNQVLSDAAEKTDETLYLIYRHGATEGSELIRAGKSKHGYTVKNVLTAKILPEAVPVLSRIAAGIKLCSIGAHYVSAYPRCVMSAMKVGESIQVMPRIDIRLMERVNINGGEKHFHKILLHSFLHMLTKRGYKRTAICTHEAVISGLSSLITGHKFTMADRYSTGTLVIIKGEKIVTIDYNDKA